MNVGRAASPLDHAPWPSARRRQASWQLTSSGRRDAGRDLQPAGQRPVDAPNFGWRGETGHSEQVRVGAGRLAPRELEQPAYDYGPCLSAAAAWPPPAAIVMRPSSGMLEAGSAGLSAARPPGSNRSSLEIARKRSDFRWTAGKLSRVAGQMAEARGRGSPDIRSSFRGGGGGA